MSQSETCPKCRTGKIKPITTFNNNWRCELCGYQEYRGDNGASSIRRTQQIKQETARISSEIKYSQSTAGAERRYNKAAKQAKGEKQGSLLGTIILIIIVLYVLSKVL